MPPELIPYIAPALERWPILAVLVAVVVIYRKQILAAVQRSVRDPLVEALGEQNRHFADNNKLFVGLGPMLSDISGTLKTSLSVLQDLREGQERQTKLLEELASIQRHILTETKVAAAEARGSRKSG